MSAHVGLQIDTDEMDNPILLPPDFEGEDTGSPFITAMSPSDFLLACQCKVALDNGGSVRIDKDKQVWICDPTTEKQERLLDKTDLTVGEIQHIGQLVGHHGHIVVQLHDACWRTVYAGRVARA